MVESGGRGKGGNGDALCGLGSWHPPWAQRLATARVLLLVNGVLGLLQGASYAYMIASITTLEKRYSFDSKVTALILIADNISELLLGPVFGYLANRVHRPRLIATSQVLCGFGLFIAATPYLVYGPALHLMSRTNGTKAVEVLCHEEEDMTSCGDSSVVIPAVVMLWTATFLNGLGSSAFYTIGLPLLDDSVTKKSSPLYISATAALRLCGPTLGFLMSSLSLRLYENPLMDPGITDLKDPRWVGAWWLGFVVLGAAIIVFSLPLFAFPRELSLPGTHSSPPKKKTTSSLDMRVWPRTRRLLSNAIYMCFVIGMSFRLLAVLGYMTFKAKYIESEYHKSASTANMFSGLVGILPAAIGIFAGGLFIKHFQPGPRLLTSLITIVEILGATGLVSALFLGCPAIQFAANTGVDNTFTLEDNGCLNSCQCSTRVFQPICGSDNRTNFFSPCFAGCETQSLIRRSDGKPNQYSNCRCFEGVATDGYCDSDCGTNFETFVTLLAVSNIVGNLAKTGNTIISFRIVEKADKSFSIGLSGAFLCLFAFIPYPIVYGAVADAACLVWGQSCGQRGNCWIYDRTKFKNYLHGLTLVLYILGSVFDVIVVVLSKRIRHLYDDDEEEEEESEEGVNLKPLDDIYKSIPFIDAEID